MADFKIEDEMFKTIVADGIIRSLTEESKAAMMQEAVNYLITEHKRTDAYSHRAVVDPSPLAVAFRNALEKVAIDVVADYLKDEKVKEFVEAALRKQIEKLLEEDWQIGDAIASAVAENIRTRLKRSDEY